MLVQKKTQERSIFSYHPVDILTDLCLILSIDLCLQVLISLPEDAPERTNVSRYTGKGHHGEHLLQNLQSQTHLDVSSLEPIESTHKECGFIIHINITKLAEYEKNLRKVVFDIAVLIFLQVETLDF